MTDLSVWLTEHQLLFTLILGPVISLVVGAVAAWWSAKRAIASERSGRIHQSAIEIARYRQAWIDDLRSDLAEITGLTSVSYIGQPPREVIERVTILAMRIRMRMNRDDRDYRRLVNSLHNAVARFLGTEEETDTPAEPLVMIAQSILKREWDRLKSDLREAEQ